MKTFSILLVCMTALMGCASNVRFFEHANKQEQIIDNTATLFIDANGSVYPKDGFQTGMDSVIQDRISVYNLALNKQLDCSSVPDDTEMKKICAIKGVSYDYHRQIQYEFWESRANHLYKHVASTNKELIFMLHGYNNDYGESKANFDLLKKQVEIIASPSSREFLFVNIHWDGFKGNPVSGAWSLAQGAGPLAGFRLRAFFNALSQQFIENGKQPPNLTFLTHSSGAFVLGALFGNPIAALPELQEPEEWEYDFFQENRTGEVDERYAIPKFKSIRIGMIAAATPTTTFNGIDKTETSPKPSGILADKVTMVFSMNKYDYALSKGFQIQNLSFLGATGSGSDKERYCKYLEVLESKSNVDRVTAIHFEKPDTPWFKPINDHALKDDGYLARKWSTNLFFQALINNNYSDPHHVTVECL